MEGTGGPQAPISSTVPLRDPPRRATEVRSLRLGEPLAVHRQGGDLSVWGEVDVATCPRLVDELSAAVEEGDTDVILDCAGVTFFSAAGISALIEARTRVAATGRRLVLRRPSYVVRRILDIVDMNDMFADTSDGTPA
jgi:anti-sigma B factor antagonist